VSGSDHARFDTTHWSLVIRAADDGSPGSRDALDALCRIYWPPIYAFLRRRGWDGADAEDLTQGFFLKLLDRGGISHARADRGRFRTFLLASLKNYLLDVNAREFALKRGGGHKLLSLDGGETEDWLAREPAPDETPEQIYDRRWAGTVLARALGRLEQIMTGAIGAERFAALRPFLSGGWSGGYAEVSRTLGIGESAVRVGVLRMRRRFGKILRDEVAQTVGAAADVDDELRHLRNILST
jgi:RNA polymerase sigma factor (sigma-70 family)